MTGPAGGLVVGAAIIREGRVLAALRSSSSGAPGWEFPGGKVEPGEEPAAALLREIDEELAAEVEVDEDDPFFPETVDLPQGWRLRVAPARLVSGEPIPREHDALRWLTAQELESVVWLEGDLPFLGRVRDLLR